MARFDILSSIGAVRYSGAPTYNGVFGKASYLEFGEISSPVPIAWEVGDYVDYTRTGLRYKLYSIPQPERRARSRARGDSIVYRNVQFFAATKDLEICPFNDLVMGDNTIHYSSQPDVNTYENVQGIADRIQANLDSFYGSGLWMVQLYTSDADVAAIMDEVKAFSVADGSCMDALDAIYSTWKGIGWIHTYENGVNVITIGRPNVQTGDNSTDLFTYGRGNGITVLSTALSGQADLVTRIYPFGSTRNMIARYYNSKTTIKDYESVYIPNLMLPITSWGQTDGKYDPKKAYKENATAISKYGLIPKRVYFDGSNDYDEIYPSIEGVTAKNIRDAKSAASDSNYVPASAEYPDATRMDEVKTVVSMPVDNGIMSDNGKKYVATYSGSGSSSGSATTMLTRQGASWYSGIIGSASGVSAGKLTVKSNLSVVVEMPKDAAPAVEFIAEVYCGGVVVQSKVVTPEVMVVPPALTTKSFTFNFPDITFSLATGGNMYVSVKANMEGASGTQASITYTAGTYTYEVQTDYTDTFTIKLKQIGFDISKQQSSISDGLCTIEFKSGFCAGRGFSVKSVAYNSSDDSWTAVCYRQEDSSLGQYFPNSIYPVATGDRFVLVDLEMPEIYIGIASARLADAAQELLDKLSTPKVVYDPQIDAKVIAEYGDVLKEGMYMMVGDAEIIGDNPVFVLIDTLTINENEANIPTYKVTLRDERYENTIARLTGEISRLNAERRASMYDSARSRYLNDTAGETSGEPTVFLRYDGNTFTYADESTVNPSSIDVLAEVFGIPSPLYQWQWLNGSTWTDISGATSQSLSVVPNGVYFGGDALVANIRCRVGSNPNYTYSDVLVVSKVIGGSGIPGEDGLSVITLQLYRRSASALGNNDRPTGNLTYDFTDDSLSGASSGAFNGWSRQFPSGSDPVYVITATKSTRESTATFAPTDWSTPVLLVENGTDGRDGTDGQDGQPGAPGSPGAPGAPGADGKDAVFLDLTNENDSFLYSADNNNTPLSGSITSTAILYKGNAPQTSGVQYSIAERSGCTSSQATINSSTGVVTVTGINSTGYVLVRATYNSQTYDAKLSLVKLVGTVKYDLVVTPDAIAYNTTTEDKSATQINVKVYRTAQNNSGGVTRALVTSFSGTNLSLKVNDSTVSGYGYNGYNITVDFTNNSYKITLIDDYVVADEETVPINKTANGADGSDGSDGSDGENAYRLDLDNENDSMLYDQEGHLLSGNVVSSAKLYYGGGDPTGTVTYSIADRSKTGNIYNVTASISGNTITVSAMTAETGWVKVAATHNNKTFYAILSLTKLVGTVKYDLVVSPDAIAYNTTTGDASSDFVNVKIYRTAQNNSGGVTRELVTSIPSGYSLLIDNLAVTTGYGSSGYTFPVSPENKSEYVVTLQTSGNDPVVVDQETIPINKSANGAPGTDGEDGAAGTDGQNALVLSVDPPVLEIPTDNVGTIASGTVLPKSKATLYDGMSPVNNATYSLPSVNEVFWNGVSYHFDAAITPESHGGRSYTERYKADDGATVLLTMNHDYMWANNTTYTSSSFTCVPSNTGASIDSSTGVISLSSAFVFYQNCYVRYIPVRASITVNETTYTFDASLIIAASRKGDKGDNGDNGSNGYTTVRVPIYQRSETMPARPTNNANYSLSSGTLISGSLDNWSLTIPSDNGLPCWVSYQYKSTNSTSDSIILVYNKWTVPVILAESSLVLTADQTTVSVPATSSGDIISASAPNVSIQCRVRRGHWEITSGVEWVLIDSYIKVYDMLYYYAGAINRTIGGYTYQHKWLCTDELVADPVMYSVDRYPTSSSYVMDEMTQERIHPDENCTKLIAGISIDSAGLVSGTPTAILGNSYPARIMATVTSSNTQLETTIVFEKAIQGERGLAGKVMRGVNVYSTNPGFDYEGMDDTDASHIYYDVVSYTTGGTTKLYYCKIYKKGNTYAKNITPGTDSDVWVEATNFNFVATDLLLAANAYIDFLTNRGLYLRDGNGDVVGGGQGGDSIILWAGGSNPATAPFRVGKDGSVFASNGIFQGRLMLPFVDVTSNKTLSTTDSSSLVIKRRNSTSPGWTLTLPNNSDFNGWMLNVYVEPIASRSDGYGSIAGSGGTYGGILIPEKATGSTLQYYATKIEATFGGYFEFICVAGQWVLTSYNAASVVFTP